MRLMSFATILLVSAAPASGAETAWQELAPDVSIRLISSGAIKAPGKTMVALELQMPQGTKTYWRVPGETGLPLELDLSASSGVAGHTVHWPYPTREEQADYTDYVYFGDTVLPIEIAVSDPSGMLALEATLGICSDICVPAQARFTLPLLDRSADMANGLRIKQALSEVPIAWDEADVLLGDVRYLPGADAIAVEIADDAIDPSDLIAAVSGDGPLFGAPQKSPQPGLVLLPILDKTDDSAPIGLSVDLTFMTDKGAYFVSRIIEAGDEATAAAS
jgi:DsbC/DsbD-like thiol-disulfide interchange protein